MDPAQCLLVVFLPPYRWIIGADAVHHLFLGGWVSYAQLELFLNSGLAGEFKREYPDAKLIAVDEAIQKKKDEGLKFDGGMQSSLTPYYLTSLCASFISMGG